MASVDFDEYTDVLYLAEQVSEQLLPALESKVRTLKQTHQQPLQHAAIDFQHQQTKVNLIKEPETKAKYGKLVFKYDERARAIQIWSKYPINRLVAQKSV
jgi:hypothetical protein